MQLVATGTRCVKRRHDLGPLMHSLNDVVLSPLGPSVGRVLPIHPKCWPCTTACRDMLKVNYEEA